MELNALQAFLAVAETGSFSRAASHLHLTQPAVSKRVAGLEHQLDVRLFDRIGKSTHLTEAGRTLFPKARLILAEVDESKKLLSNLSGAIAGKLKLGTSHHIGLHRLPALLRQYHERYPAVALDIEFTDSEMACDQVLKGDLELAVVTLPSETDTQLSMQTIWIDPLICVANNRHPLVNRDSKITVETLAQHEALLPSRATATRKIVEGLFSNQNLSPRIGMETNYLETLKMMTSIGLGWTALPEKMIDEDLVRVELDAPAIVRHLGIVTHRERTLSNAALEFLNLLPG